MIATTRRTAAQAGTLLAVVLVLAAATLAFAAVSDAADDSSATCTIEQSDSGRYFAVYGPVDDGDYYATVMVNGEDYVGIPTGLVMASNGMIYIPLTQEPPEGSTILVTIGTTPGSSDVCSDLRVDYGGSTTDTATITVTPSQNGEVSVRPSGPVTVGTKVEITASADSGYQLTDLTVNGESIFVAGQTEYTYRVTENVTIAATFGLIPIDPDTVTFNANGGTGSMEPMDAVEGSITAPNCGFTRDGYRFAGWNTASNGSGTSYAVGATVPVNDDMTLYAQWVLQVDVSVNDPVNGSVTVSSSGTVDAGTRITVEVSADQGYRLKSVLINDDDVTSEFADGSYMFTVESDTEIVVEFEGIPPEMFDVSVADGIANGTVTVEPVGEVKDGREISITAIADNGYRILSILVNGEVIYISTSDETTRKVTHTVTADTVVSAVFESVNIPIVTHTVTLEYDKTQGSVDGPGEVRDGTVTTYDIYASSGFVISKVTVDGEDVPGVSGTATYRLTVTVEDDMTIEVVFTEAQTYTVTIGEMENGRVTASSYEVEQGRHVTLTIVPDQNYRLGSLIVNGTDVTDRVENGRYTFTVTGNITVDATFTFAPVPGEDDDEYVPPDITVVTDDEDNTTTYIVAIAAGVVVAILAALILMQTRKS